MAMPPDGAQRPPDFDTRSYLASPSFSGVMSAATLGSPSILAGSHFYSQTSGGRNHPPPRSRLRSAHNVSSTAPGTGVASEIAVPGLRQVHLVEMPAIRVEEPLTEEQRDLYISPALRSNRFGSGRLGGRLGLIEEMEHVARLPATMRSAGQEVLDANVAGGLQDSEAASPTARIRELSRLRKAHMAAAEQIRLKEYEIAERDRENLEALPSSDGPLFTLSGKTEAQLIRELQFKRRLAAKDPRISRLPEPSSETIPRTASVMPALPQPSHRRTDQSELRAIRTTEMAADRYAPTRFAMSSRSQPNTKSPGAPLLSSVGMIPLEKGSIRPGSSVSNVPAQPSMVDGLTGLARVRYADTHHGLRPMGPQALSVVSEQPRSQVRMAIPADPELRRTESFKSNVHQTSQHEYLYDLDRAHASRGLPCFCCE